jgi:hypothetical protein
MMLPAGSRKRGDLGFVGADRLDNLAAVREHCLDGVVDAVDHDGEEQPWLFGGWSADHPGPADLADALELGAPCGYCR